MKDNAQLINQDSGNTEWYTPIEIVDMAREVMGRIDLDPFSSAKANEQIKAIKYFSIGDDPFGVSWEGNIWMNHPFGRDMNNYCVEKLVRDYQIGTIKSACCITFAATSEQWFRPLLGYLQCFIHGRTNYYLPDGTKKKGVTKGSVVTYLGEDTEKFREVFSKIGTCK